MLFANLKKSEIPPIELYTGLAAYENLESLLADIDTGGMADMDEHNDKLTQAAREAFFMGILAGIRTPPRTSVSQWADNNRVLSTKYSAEAGPWSTARVEYGREIMDCWTNPDVEIITLMSGTQMAKTEIELNCVGMVIDVDPAPIMCMYPTDSATEKFSKRFDDMVANCPAIRSKVSESKSRDSANTKTHKEFQGGYITFIGAQSPTDLASLPIRYLIEDEIDKYPMSAGCEGSPEKLAEARTSNFPNRKIIKVSSPSVMGKSNIHKSYLAGDQRRYYIPCPKCAHMQLLEWENVRWIQDDHGNHLPQTAYILCTNPDCGHHWTDTERKIAIGRGKWRAAAPFHGHASFWISSLYSPFVPLSKHVKQFIAANEEFKETGNLNDLIVFVNTILAQPWEEKGERADDIDLLARREDYGDVLPADVICVTAAVDVQIDRLEIQIVGWDQHRRAYGMGRTVLHGDPNGTIIWDELDSLLESPIPHKLCEKMPIYAMVIDTGYLPTRVEMFVAAHMGRRVWGIKGIFGRQDLPMWEKQASTRAKGRAVRFINIGVDAARTEYYGRLRLGLDQPGSIHINMNYSDVDCEEMVAEEVKTRWVKGRKKREWSKKPGAKRNELFDLWTYNIALFSHLIQEGLNPTMLHQKMRMRFAGDIYPNSTHVHRTDKPVYSIFQPAAPSTQTVFGKAVKQK